jgi:hypothetical protein
MTRGVSENSFEGKNATRLSTAIYQDLVLQSDKVLNY